MQFERFTSFGRGYSPMCSIRTNAQIGFNRGAIHRFNLSDGYAILYYDKTDRVIGIQPTDDEHAEGATRLIVKDNNAFVSGKSFLEYYNIPYGGGTQTFSAEWNESYGMIIIDLKKPLKQNVVTAAAEEQ